MEESTERRNIIPPDGQKPRARSAATLTVFGLLCVIAAFSILYRAERTNNKSWIASRADLISPDRPGKEGRMVRFTGIPQEGLIEDADTGRTFVYVSKSRYEYAKGDGPSAKPDWKYLGNSSELAKSIRIGTVRVRLSEAEILGRRSWSTTIRRPDRGEGIEPRIGDTKLEVSGIPGDIPLFCVGRYAGGFLGSGPFCVVSAYSEGKTLDELKETWVWRWMRNPVCFFLLVVGFVLLGSPAMGLLRAYSHLPAVQPFARIGWPAYLVITIAFSFFAVRFSAVTADLLWVIIALTVGIPIAVIVVKMKGKKVA